MVLVTFFSPDATSLLSFPVFLGVALALLLAMEIGYRIGRWHQKIGRGSIKEFVGIIDAPILALLGLLIGFTFFGAAERFERRRDLIVEETNHIGTLISGSIFSGPRIGMRCAPFSRRTLTPESKRMPSCRM